MLSFGYHEYRLYKFSDQLSSWASGAGFEILRSERTVTAGAGSGSYCSYTAAIVVRNVPDYVEQEISIFLVTPFKTPESSLHPKVDLAVQRLDDTVRLSIHSGAYRSLLDPRCL